MSKYIRVNNNIWFLLRKCKHNIVLVGKTFLDFGTFITIDKNTKIADTIEELCDMFIKKSNEEDNDYFEIGRNFWLVCDKKYNMYDLKHYNYYGAIWTDKGLIYIAKMNDKGELELL